MVKASAPGKCILFGEHAVVYGQPAVACSINKRMVVELEEEHKFNSWRLDGAILNFSKHPHVDFLKDQLWPENVKPPLKIRIRGTVPAASGLGSSAALSVALVAALQQLRDEDIDAGIAGLLSHQAEAFAQGGRASPIDTATSASGGFVVLSDTVNETLDHIGERSLQYQDEITTWQLHSFIADIPDDTFLVIGNTGVHASTSKQVAKVASLLEKQPERHVEIEAIGSIARRGIEALRAGDMESVGKAMTENHIVLRSLGVSSPELEKLIKAAAPSSLGVKLTGSGGGGCMIALTKNPEQTVGAIEMEGGRAFISPFNSPGVRIETLSSQDSGPQ